MFLHFDQMIFEETSKNKKIENESQKHRIQYNENRRPCMTKTYMWKIHKNFKQIFDHCNTVETFK